jgi:prolyl-tRNA editing enzyme YbaK/EbsC (Cys-tRNA(Pro) deacylase)
MSSNITSAVTALLQSKDIAYDVIEIPLSEDKKPVRSLEELLTAKGLDHNSVVRSVVFKAESGQYALLAVAGGGRADWGLLRAYLNERKLRMAEYDEVSEVTGYMVGAVPPIALPDSVRVLVDNSVSSYEFVVIGSGVLGYALSLKGQDLSSLMVNKEWGSFVKLES